MTLRATLKALCEQSELYYLVYWSDEQSVSAVQNSAIKTPAPEAISTGVECQVKVGRKLYTGKIAASGSKQEMVCLEERFIAGTWILPFGSALTDLSNKTAITEPADSSNKTAITEPIDSSNKTAITEPPTKKRCRQGKSGKENVVKGKRKASSPKKAKRSQVQSQKPKALVNILRVTAHGGMSKDQPAKQTEGEAVDLTKEIEQTEEATDLTKGVEQMEEATDLTKDVEQMKEEATDLTKEIEQTEDSSLALSESDLLLLELTVQKLQENQESILVRLAAIEQLLKDGKGPQLQGGHATTDHGDCSEQGSDSEESYFEPDGANNLYSYELDDLYYHDNPNDPAQPLPPWHSLPPNPHHTQPPTPHHTQPPTPHHTQPLTPHHTQLLTHQQTHRQLYRSPQERQQLYSYPSPQPFSHSSPQDPRQSYSHQSQPLDSGRGQPPRCQPIKPKKNAKITPSSVICKEKLAAAATIVSKYSKLCCESKAPTLATKLARESFFGDKVLASCTVMGCREYNGLPIHELTQLKQTLFNQLPQYWSNPVEFEPVWVSCTESIGQACKRLQWP